MLKNKPSQYLIYGLLIGALVGMFIDNLVMGMVIGMLFGLGIKNTKEHYEKYLQFRTEDGTIDAIASLCSDTPSIRIFDIIPT